MELKIRYTWHLHLIIHFLKFFFRVLISSFSIQNVSLPIAILIPQRIITLSLLPEVVAVIWWLNLKSFNIKKLTARCRKENTLVYIISFKLVSIKTHLVSYYTSATSQKFYNICPITAKLFSRKVQIPLTDDAGFHPKCTDTLEK